MALNLITKKTPVKIGILTLDAALSVAHQKTADVTEFEVEKGSKITDHIRAKPVTVTISGIVTNTPIGTAQNERVVQLTGFEFRSSIPGANAVENPGYVQSAYLELKRIFEARELVKIVTELEAYENMVMRSLDVPRDARTGDALRFTAQFQQVRLVSNLTTTETVPKEPRGNKKKPKGDKPAETPPEGEVVKSWFVGLNDASGDPLGTKQFARKVPRK